MNKIILVNGQELHYAHFKQKKSNILKVWVFQGMERATMKMYFSNSDILSYKDGYFDCAPLYRYGFINNVAFPVQLKGNMLPEVNLDIIKGNKWKLKTNTTLELL